MEPAAHGLSSKARCLTAVAGDNERNRFLVGTFSAKEKDGNEIQLLEVNVVENDIELMHIFPHSASVWSLETSPFDPNLFFSCYVSVSERKSSMRASLWRMKESFNDSSLEEVVELKGHAGSVRKVLWNKSIESNVYSFDDKSIKTWKLAEGSATELSSIPLGNVRKLTSATLDPHFDDQVATTVDESVLVWDLKSNKKCYSIPKAHASTTRDMDFNPNKPYYFATGGDDCKVKFWDSRKLDQPVKSFQGHSHWVYKVQYNRFCDQLVLSSSTDSMINLWNVYSISSASSLLPVDNNDMRLAPEDKQIKTYDEHEDSVYSIAWSNNDSWTFASLSFDGRIVINTVPEDLTYKILLSKDPTRGSLLGKD